jgi:hypothetical protein
MRPMHAAEDAVIGRRGCQRTLGYQCPQNTCIPCTQADMPQGVLTQ